VLSEIFGKAVEERRPRMNETILLRSKGLSEIHRKQISLLRDWRKYLKEEESILERNIKFLSVYKKDNTYLSELDSDEERSVWKVTKNPGRWRHYYIFYKNKFVTDRNSPIKVLKLSYDAQSSAHYNYIIHDNLCRKVEHGKLDILLRQNGLNFGDFNDAWYYIENDYNNR
jgi:hypothetical protein